MAPFVFSIDVDRDDPEAFEARLQEAAFAYVERLDQVIRERGSIDSHLLNERQLLPKEWKEALAPGFILTDLTEKLWSDPTMREWGVANTPQRRLGVPEDMAGTALFLASAASRFMTGQILYVDGGFTAK